MPKKKWNFEESLNYPQVEKNNTKVRILGTALETPFRLESQTYGNFKNPEKKYIKTGVKDTLFENFIKTFVEKENEDKKALEESIKNIRMFNPTSSEVVIKQKCDYTTLGKRHMYTQDCFPIPENRPDKLFMANHDVSKYPSIIPEKIADNYVDKFIPYYKDKEITYWSMNLEKSNIYRSNSNGINPFGKTSGFTQPLSEVRSATQFHGNVSSTKDSKNIFLDETDVQFSENYRQEKETVKNIILKLILT